MSLWQTFIEWEKSGNAKAATVHVCSHSFANFVVEANDGLNVSTKPHHRHKSRLLMIDIDSSVVHYTLYYTNEPAKTNNIHYVYDSRSKVVFCTCALSFFKLYTWSSKLQQITRRQRYNSFEYIVMKHRFLLDLSQKVYSFVTKEIKSNTRWFIARELFKSVTGFKMQRVVMFALI